jgi:hypothetical protein
MTLRGPSCLRLAFLYLGLMSSTATGLSQPRMTRRSALLLGPAAILSSAATVIAIPAAADAASAGPDLQFQTSASGMQWADAKVGTGTPLKRGTTATIDYVMSTTGARYGSRIFGTADKDMPYRWILGDGSTIDGLEQAILGKEGDGANENGNGNGNALPPMLPGGIRRVVIPQTLGFMALAESTAKCVQDGQPGPIPPPNQAFEEYQRFKNIYCNPNRQYQPDLVMDIKLYGARSLR